jgi:hypothetical protein
MQRTPPALSNDPANRQAMSHLRGKSAHSDLAMPLFDAVRGLPDAETWCADPERFGFVVAHTDGVVFAFAEGMHGLTLRLPPEASREAVAAGANAAQVGGDWWFFPLFVNARIDRHIEEWAERAYAYARQEK